MQGLDPDLVVTLVGAFLVIPGVVEPPTSATAAKASTLCKC